MFCVTYAYFYLKFEKYKNSFHKSIFIFFLHGDNYFKVGKMFLRKQQKRTSNSKGDL